VLDEVERQHRIEHGHLDPLAFPGALTMEERGQHRLHDRQRGDLVAEGRRDEVRDADRRGVQLRITRQRLDDVVVGGSVGGTGVAAETVRLAVDEPGPARRDVLVGQA
jgi:hypothetical protein